MNNKTSLVPLANEIVAWLKDYAEKSGRKAWVIGVSGGVDSALVSTLCAMTGLPTHCVILPCESRENETERGGKHIDWLMERFGTDVVKFHKIDLTYTFVAFADSCCDTDTGSYYDELGFANSKSRLRMIALYHIATCTGGLVVGTGNLIEDYHLFFYTKGGDGQVDIAPIGDLTKTEVRQMCRELGVLPELSEAIPTDGLWENARTDEQQLGGSYEEFEWAMTFLKSNNGWPMDSTIAKLTKRQAEILVIYEKWHKAGLHKSLPIPTFRRKM